MLGSGSDAGQGAARSAGSRGGLSSREAAFSEFARARMPHLYRSAWLLCGDRHRAEDLVQETLIKVYARWGPAISNPAAYAQTTLTRTWISQQRRRSTHEQPLDPLPDGLAPTPKPELRLTLLQALATLEPLDRAVVVLRYLDDATSADVAELLNLSDAAVRSRLMRALRRLRDRLDLPYSDLINEGVLP